MRVLIKTKLLGGLVEISSGNDPSWWHSIAARPRLMHVTVEYFTPGSSSRSLACSPGMVAHQALRFGILALVIGGASLNRLHAIEVLPVAQISLLAGSKVWTCNSLVPSPSTVACTNVTC